MSESLTDFNETHLTNPKKPEPRSVPVRVSWQSISEQIMSVLNIERGIFYSLVELFFRPGKAVRKHLFKNRKLLVNPVRFLVLSTTIATFIAFYYMDQTSIGSDFQEGFLSVDTGSKNSDERVVKEIIPIFFELFKQFVNISYFFLVPAGAFISWLFVKRSYNVPELAVAHCYMWSMVNCFTILFTPLVAINDAFLLIVGILGFFYPFYFYTKFFNQGTKGMIKGIIINGLNYFFLVLFFLVLGYFYFRNIEDIVFPHSVKF